MPGRLVDSEFSYKGFGQSIMSGLSTIDSLGEYLEVQGYRHALVLHGRKTAEHSNVVLRVTEALNGRVVATFGGVEPHSPLDVVREAAQLARDSMPDVLVSVGGGSAVTIAKGVALAMSTDLDLRIFERTLRAPDVVIEPETPLPDVQPAVVAVPTTIGCAEIGPTGGGFYDRERGRKLLLFGDGRTSAEHIVIDGEALATTPSIIQQSTAVGQLRVAIEAHNSVFHNPIGDGLSLHAVRLLASDLRDKWQGDPGSLLRLKAGGCLAELSLVAVGSLGLNSAIAHHLGAIAGVPHGVANAVLLPHTVRYNGQSVEPSRLRQLSEALLPQVGKLPSRRSEGSEEDSIEAMAGAIEELCSVHGLPTRLRELDVAKSVFDAIARATLGDWSLRGNPRPITTQNQVMEVLESAW